MKVSKGFIMTAFKVREKASGKTYDCFLQEYEWTNGEKNTRFNIGINGWLEWGFCFYLDENEFNERFEIL